MLRNFAFALFLSFFSCCVNAEAQQCKGSSIEKLENGMSVIFVETSKSDSLMVVLSVSAGSTDEVDKEGVANVLSKVLASKYMNNLNGNALQYGTESNSYAGYDQSVYYLCGKLENLDAFVKNLGDLFTVSSLNPADVEATKHLVGQNIDKEDQSDRTVIKKEARKSMYWHSKYGSSVSGTKDGLKLISKDDVEMFKQKHYTPNRATIIIAGNVKKEEALKVVNKYFGSTKTKSTINRLKEPDHHGSVTRITKTSEQVSVPVIDIYWKVPNYRQDKAIAKAAEIYINHMSEALQKSLIDEQKIAATISFSYSLWNYESGDFCMTITAPNASIDVDDLITAVLTEIKYIASEGVAKERADVASKKLFEASKTNDRDILEVLDIFSRRMGAGHDFNSVRNFSTDNDYSFDEVNKQAKEIFGKEPCVICVTTPRGKAMVNATGGRR
ncbi:peptidase M16 [Alphaproteobacteria bacterium]|nr:peptidase M16 [Alphaproteobacteria bacterium]